MCIFMDGMAVKAEEERPTPDEQQLVNTNLSPGTQILGQPSMPQQGDEKTRDNCLSCSTRPTFSQSLKVHAFSGTTLISAL